MSDQTFKFDAGKPKYRLIPPRALKEVAEILTYGARKYSEHSWIFVESERYLDAAYRHMELFRLGERFDKESGLHHLAMAATNLLFLTERELNDISEISTKVATYYEEINKEKNKESQ